MNKILLAFAAGVTLVQWMPSLPHSRWALLLAAIVWLWRWQWLRPVAALAVGIGWGTLQGYWMLQHQLPQELEGVDLVVEGEVVSLPVQRQGLVRFELAPKRLTRIQGYTLTPRKLRLSWYDAPEHIEAGQVWRLTVRLKRPRGLQNPAGFDYGQWLFTQRIDATGYVRSDPHNRLMQAGFWPQSLHSLRDHIATRLDSHLEAGTAAAVIKALNLGDRRGLDNDAWRVFSRTGTSHLIAISGLHVGLVAGWLWFIAQWCWRRSARLCLWFPAQRAGALFALLGALIYAALAGFSLPTQRALVMIAVTLGGVALAQPVSPARSLSLALFLVILLDPLAPLTVGFWLSFGAVALILLVLTGRLSRGSRFSQLLRVQWAISVGLMPLLFLHFGEASVISPLINLLMVPWFALILVPMSLIGLLILPLPVLAGPWYSLLQLLTDQTLQLLSWLAELSIATAQLAHLPDWLALSALFGVVLLLLPGGIPGRSLGLLLIAPILWVESPRPDTGEIRFTLLDVGQGLACVVETEKHLMVYDTGPAYASGFSASKAALLPYLASRDLSRIDLLVLSNGDRDHAGGVAVVEAELEVDDRVSGEHEGLLGFRSCRAGEAWSWDGVEIRVLHPSSSQRFSKANDNSCVVHVSNGSWSLLLAGDIEREGERSLLAKAGKQLQSDILVAPHHGSATSSSEAFVQAVKPEWVIFSTGYRNRYGFPRQSVVERWRGAGADTINSAQAGAVSFHIYPDQRSPEITQERDRRRRYWQAR
jgi:competence protein ComEC